MIAAGDVTRHTSENSTAVVPLNPVSDIYLHINKHYSPQNKAKDSRKKEKIHAPVTQITIGKDYYGESNEEEGDGHLLEWGIEGHPDGQEKRNSTEENCNVLHDTR